jgi:acetyl-CoA synthetase
MTSSNDKTYWPKNRYLEVYNRSIEDPEGFWSDEARKLDWFRTWDKVLEWNAPFAKWFVGGILISQAPAIQIPPLKPGSASFPLPGVAAQVVNDQGQPVPAGERGLLILTKPWPGMLMTLYKDDDRFKEAYWNRFPGNYLTGDYSIQDEDGYFWLLGRADEVIKVAGHRLGTLELENATISYPAVAEAAAIAKPDEVKGESITIFAILREGYEPSPEMEKNIKNHIRNTMGPIATPEKVVLVKKLPKTRSGKIMRRLLKAVAMEVPIGDATTLEDGASIAEVQAAYEDLKGSA